MECDVESHQGEFASEHNRELDFGGDHLALAGEPCGGVNRIIKMTTALTNFYITRPQLKTSGDQTTAQCWFRLSASDLQTSPDLLAL
jgi:hypothetical protein